MIITKKRNIENLDHVIKGIIEFNQCFEILPRNFKDTFKFHYFQAKEKRIINSYDELEYESDISEKTLRGYKNGKNIPSKINVIKIGLALRLPSQYIIDLLEKADCKICLNNEYNTLLLTIIYCYSQLGIEKVYEELKKYNRESLLNLSNKYLKNHNLIK